MLTFSNILVNHMKKMNAGLVHQSRCNNESNAYWLERVMCNKLATIAKWAFIYLFKIKGQIMESMDIVSIILFIRAVFLSLKSST